MDHFENYCSTVRKSADIMDFEWFLRNVFHLCPIVLPPLLGKYLWTVDWETSYPNFNNSPWTLRTPHNGFSITICFISSITSLLILERPPLLFFVFLFQKIRNPFLCHHISVSSFTMNIFSFQFVNKFIITLKNIRSVIFVFILGVVLWRISICLIRNNISSFNWRLVLNKFRKNRSNGLSIKLNDC